MPTTFQQVQSLIKKNPDQARKYVADWQLLQARHPELFSIESDAAWDDWLSRHRNLDIDKEMFVGKLIEEAYFNGLDEKASSDTSNDQSGNTPGTSLFGNVVGGLAGGLVVGAFSSPELVESDKGFRNIKKEMMQEWLQKNNQTNFNSEEGQDFLHGSLDGNGRSLDELVFERFRRQDLEKNKGKKVKKYDEKAKVIYDSNWVDPAVEVRRNDIKKIANRRFEILKAKNPKTDYGEVLRKTKLNKWVEFARMYPEKAQAYSSDNPDIKVAVGREQLFKLQAANIGPQKESVFLKRKAEKERERQQSGEAGSSSAGQPAPQTQSPNPNDFRRFTRITQNLRPLSEPPPMTSSSPPPSEPSGPSQPSSSPSQPGGRGGGNAIDRINNAKNSLQNIQKAMRAARGAATAARSVVVLMNPWVLGGIGLVLLLIIIIAILIALGIIKPSSSGDIGIPGLTLEKSGPSQVANGSEITYTLLATYTQNSEIEITDPIPQNTAFISASGKYKNENGNVIWTLKENPPEATSNGEKKYSFVLTVKPTKDDIIVYNQATAKVTAAANPGIPNPDNPATADNCGGKYNLSATPLKSNFGDPLCDFTKDKLYTLLQQLDSGNADFWFVVARCESRYNPNIWRDPTIPPKTPDPVGAWGLFQMGRGRNGPYDHGDVNWEQQASNAIMYYKTVLIPRKMSIAEYWACAR